MIYLIYYTTIAWKLVGKLQTLCAMPNAQPVQQLARGRAEWNPSWPEPVEARASAHGSKCFSCLLITSIKFLSSQHKIYSSFFLLHLLYASLIFSYQIYEFFPGNACFSALSVSIVCFSCVHICNICLPSLSISDICFSVLLPSEICFCSLLTCKLWCFFLLTVI
jgi:hypothetical protein